MGFFNNGKKKQKRNKDPVAIWLNSDSAKDILLPSGYVRVSENQEVKKCVHKIADLVSLMTIMLMQNAEYGDKRIKNELSKKIDIYPSKIMTRKNFIYQIATNMLIGGNCVVVPIIKDGLFDDFKILDPAKVTFHSLDDYNYTINHNCKTLYPDEVLHFKICPDPDSPYQGRGYADMVKSSIETLVQATATKKGFLKSKWKPSLIISITADVEELSTAEQREKILNSYTETTNAGDPWLIPAGEIDVKEVKPLTLKDLAVQESIELDIKSIASAFGVPPFMLGIGGNFNKDEYNNFVSTTIMSIATEIQQELTIKLLHGADWYFKLNPKALMQYQLSEKMSFVKEMIGGGMLSRNEGRNEFDYSPVDDPAMNEYNVLENYIPIGKLGDQKKLNNTGDTEDEK